MYKRQTQNRRYLYVNPRFYALRRNLFDQNRPTDSLRAELPDSEPITVLMRADATSTLYLTQRFSALSGDEIVPYFSPASEVFGTRSLAFGDVYTFSGQRLSGDTAGLREIVLAAAQTPDAYAETIRENYLALPGNFDTAVYTLAGEITQDAQTDFDRASALCAYLRSAYPYTLLQNMPPDNRDFVSWFLLDERQGYCTSFATAMAVMAVSYTHLDAYKRQHCISANAIAVSPSCDSDSRIDRPPICSNFSRAAPVSKTPGFPLCSCVTSICHGITPCAKPVPSALATASFAANIAAALWPTALPRPCR